MNDKIQTGDWTEEQSAEEPSDQADPSSWAIFGEESEQRAQGEEGGDGFPKDCENSFCDTSYFNSSPSRKTWVVLALILIVIAIAILYVYQAGDRKTVLGNQPIPAGQTYTATLPVAQQTPIGGVQNVPSGGGMINTAAQGAQRNAPDRGLSNRVGTTKSAVSCPNCGTTGISACATCGALLQPFGKVPGLFACPVCGVAGVPICPRCGTHMAGKVHAGHQQVVQAGTNVGGQFHCPICQSTGLPNWDQNGKPICPSCGAKMDVMRQRGVNTGKHAL